MDRGREYAIAIIDCFENLLYEKDMIIPSEDREGDEGEAAIFGSEYAELEDNITNILQKYEKEILDEKHIISPVHFESKGENEL